MVEIDGMFKSRGSNILFEMFIEELESGGRLNSGNMGCGKFGRVLGIGVAGNNDILIGIVDKFEGESKVVCRRLS